MKLMGFLALCIVATASQKGWAEGSKQIGDWTFSGDPSYKCVIEIENETGDVIAVELYYSEANGRSGLLIADLNEIDLPPNKEVVKFQLFATNETDPTRRLPIYYGPHSFGNMTFLSLENPFHFSRVVSYLSGAEKLRMAPFGNENFPSDFLVEWSAFKAKDAFRELTECSSTPP
ncbi:MAG: hypothetical protein AAF678_11220 [Pseudomonadota bacterium]